MRYEPQARGPLLKLKHILWLAGLWAAASSPLAAQGGLYREATFTAAYMMPNNFNMMGYAAASAGVEATAWWRVQGDEWWKSRRGYPSFGFKGSVAFVPGGIAGHRLGLAGMLRGPLWRQVDYQLGLGLSYYTNSQYFTGDPENIFISTLVSCLIDVGCVWHLGDDQLVTFALVHSSNGMLNRPNKGLNYLQVGYGFALDPVAQGGGGEAQPRPPFARHEFGVALSGGLTAPRNLHFHPQHLYPCYDLSLNYQYYLDPVVAVGGTLDFWYNFSDRDVALRYGQRWRMPLYFGGLAYVEGFWGPLSVKAGIGPSLGGEEVGIPFYERVGVYYNFRRFYAGVALNAHAGVIEFIEWTVGRRF